jgi:hypothetical protein
VSEPAVSEWVTIIHPGTGGTAEVNRSSLPQLYASGWRLLAPDEVADPEPEPVPPPMTRAEATVTEEE